MSRNEMDRKEESRIQILRLSREKSLNAQDHFNLLLACARLGTYIPEIGIPESIDSSKMSKHARDLLAHGDARGDVEIGTVFFADLEQNKVLRGRIVSGSADAVSLDNNPQDWKSQIPIIDMHTHPRHSLVDGICPFSSTDFISFLADPRLVGSALVMGQHIVYVLKTTQTKYPSIEQMMSRVKSIFSKNIKPHGLSTQEAIRANKDVCLEYSLALYLGKLDEDLKRKPLHQPTRE